MPPKKDEQSAKFYPIGFSLDDWKYLLLWNNAPVDWAQYEIDAAAREKEGKTWKPPGNATTQFNAVVERMRLMASGGPHSRPKAKPGTIPRKPIPRWVKAEAERQGMTERDFVICRLQEWREKEGKS